MNVVALVFTAFFVPSQRGTLLPVIFFGLSHLPSVNCVTCHFCMDTIAGCTGGNACPLVTDVAANRAVIASNRLGGSLVVKNLFPHEIANLFCKPVIEACLGYHTQPVNGGAVDFSDGNHATSTSVVQAALFGHCTMDEAVLELSSRLEVAAGADAIAKVQGAIDLLRSKTDTLYSSSHGIYTFIWAKISSLFSSDSAIRMTRTSKKVDVSATLTRPKTESQFYELINIFMLVIVSFGITSHTVVFQFISDVVHHTIRVLKEPFTVAHELVLCYFMEIEQDGTRSLNLGNIFRARGGQDTFLKQARLNAATFFRSGGANPLANGEFNVDSDKPCIAFNKGLPCDHVDANGKCKFNHRCMQWVSDKGPRGMCWAAHPKCKCSYDASKKLDKPSK